MSNGNSAITWRQIGVIIAMFGALMVSGGILFSKADKTELVKVENRCGEKVDKLEVRVKDDINDIKEKVNKTYDLLLSIYTNEK